MLATLTNDFRSRVLNFQAQLTCLFDNVRHTGHCIALGLTGHKNYLSITHSLPPGTTKLNEKQGILLFMGYTIFTPTHVFTVTF